MVYTYSIGLGQRSQSLKNNNPGPGQYSPTKRAREASPKWKIGTSERQRWSVNKNPGPGQYKNINFLDSQKEKSPGYLFGVKTIYKPINPDNPGPGAYDYSPLIGNAPAFSLGGKSPDFLQTSPEKSQDIPGPGFYDTANINSLSSRGTKIGTSKRDQYYQKNDAPGPGQYELSSLKKETPMFSFGSNERKANYLSQTTSNLMNVGPGTYDLRSTLRLDKGNTMVPKRSDNTLQVQAALPGPGAYEPEFSKIKKQQPLYKIGKSERSKSPTNNIPGPGKYNPMTTIVYQTTPNFRIGSSLRQNLDLRTPSPGPAAYDINTKVFDGNPKYSISPKREDKTYLREKQYSPGPDRYNVTTVLVKERSFAYKIGKSQRDFVRIEKNPGPGAYSTLNNNPYQGTMYSFGRDTRIKPTYKDELPGPGAYQLKSFVEDYPNFVFPKDED